MPPSNQENRRKHNVMLVTELLDQRSSRGAAPFTLVLDSTEQSGRPLVGEYLRRAAAANIATIWVSFTEDLQMPKNVDHMVRTDGTPEDWEYHKRIIVDKTKSAKRVLIICDSMNMLAEIENDDLTSVLYSLISPTSSFLGMYHTDMPMPTERRAAYALPPLRELEAAATAIYTLTSFHHTLEKRAAQGRSHEDPSYGLEQRINGVSQAVGQNGLKGMSMKLEYRRKSGNTVKEYYYVLTSFGGFAAPEKTQKYREFATLLEDHPLVQLPHETGTAEEDGAEGTFNLNLTERQRADRDGVVLPYFDAQHGGAEGGRILYDMGAEDDFDEEEDEI